MTTPGHGHTHGGDGRFLRTVDTVERDAAAARLRAHGHTFASIAEDLGFADRSAARKAVERCLADTIAEPAADLRAHELTSLDDLTARAWRVVNGDHYVISGGKIVRDGFGTPVPDAGPVLAAMDRLIKISERRSRLLGLDAPTQVMPLSLDVLDAEIVALQAEVEQQERDVHAAEAAEVASEATAALALLHRPTDG